MADGPKVYGNFSREASLHWLLVSKRPLKLLIEALTTVKLYERRPQPFEEKMTYIHDEKMGDHNTLYSLTSLCLTNNFRGLMLDTYN